MIGALVGTIWEIHPSSIILLVGGVGYLVTIPNKVTKELTLNQQKTFYIHTHLRDEILALYGFITKEELRLFELLLDVSGIGPRSAVTIVDRGVSTVEKAVSQSDVDFFLTIPRIGKKNAQKIIIDLKSKIGSVKELNLADETTGETKQVIDALVSMGFDKKEVTLALQNMSDTEKTIEQKIRSVLQNVSKK